MTHSSQSFFGCLTEKHLPDTRRFLFRSKRFPIRIGEDAETNPFLYGKELADWLRNELLGSYRSIEDVIPEDWGWCVMCGRDPFRFFVVVVNTIDQGLINAIAKQEPPEDMLWYVEPVVEVPFWRQSASREEAEKIVDELHRRLRAILEREPEIRILSDREIEEWDSATPDDLTVPHELMPPPARVSRWITLPLGVLLLPVLVLCVFGGVSLFIDPPRDVVLARIVIGTVVLAASYGFGVVVFRLITGRESPYGGLFPPGALKGLAIVFGAMPVGLAFTGMYSDEPIRGLAVAAVWIFMAVGIWRTATRRIRRAASVDTEI